LKERDLEASKSQVAPRDLDGHPDLRGVTRAGELGRSNTVEIDIVGTEGGVNGSAPGDRPEARDIGLGVVWFEAVGPAARGGETRSPATLSIASAIDGGVTRIGLRAGRTAVRRIVLADLSARARRFASPTGLGGESAGLSQAPVERLVQAFVVRATGLGVDALAGSRIADAVFSTVDVILSAQIGLALVGLFVTKCALQAHRIHALAVLGVDAPLGFETTDAALAGQRTAELFLRPASPVDTPLLGGAVGLIRAGVLDDTLPGRRLTDALFAGLLVAAIRPARIVLGAVGALHAVDGLKTATAILASTLLTDA
jgi:hypothetical protein